MTIVAATTRVLVAVRLSRVTDKGKTRIERDDELAEKWATGRQGCEIVGRAEDAGVSGSVSPWVRKGLGPWLKQPELVDSYDEIVASTIDRVGRSARDLNDLKAWAEDNGKTLRILKPELTWPVPDGVEGASSRIMWALLGELAEIERSLTKQRYADVQGRLRDDEALVGKPPWGFKVIGEKYGKNLAPDPKLVPHLRGMIERALRGDTYLSIGRWLDSEGVAPFGGDKWAPKSVTNVLRNPALKGRRVDADGKVLLKFDSLLTAAQYNELQNALDSRPGRRGPITAKTPRLTGVIECGSCGGPMYRSPSVVAGKVYAYYRCKGPAKSPSTCSNAVKTDFIEQFVDRWFTEWAPYANDEVIETIVIPGDDHVAEVAEIEAEIRELDLDADDYEDRSRSLRAERTRLKALPSEPTQMIEHPTGVTVGEVWKTLDDEAKRGYMLAAGVKVRVQANAALRKADKDDYLLTGGDPHKILGTLQQVLRKDG